MVQSSQATWMNLSFIFRVLDDKSIGATAAAAEEANITARPRSMIERAGSTPEAPEPEAPDFYKIKLLTPLFRRLHEQLSQLGVKLIERVEVNRVPDSDLHRAPCGGALLHRPVKLLKIV
jgi:hypothetical protein